VNGSFKNFNFYFCDFEGENIMGRKKNKKFQDINLVKVLKGVEPFCNLKFPLLQEVMGQGIPSCSSCRT
jgi:hypothetical protein